MQTVDIARTEVVGDPMFGVGAVSLRRDQLFLMKMNSADAQGLLQDLAGCQSQRRRFVDARGDGPRHQGKPAGRAIGPVARHDRLPCTLA